MKRQFTAERTDQLWIADITPVAVWTGSVHLAFVIDVFWLARGVVNEDGLVLDALEQALWARTLAPSGCG